MTDDTTRSTQARDDERTPGSAPYGPNLRTSADATPDEEDPTAAPSEQPGAGVTDVQGQPLAGSSHGGAMGS
jgi:hypothetical protein